MRSAPLLPLLLASTLAALTPTTIAMKGRTEALANESFAPTSVPTQAPTADADSLTTGYICAAVAVVAFGSNFAPVKAYDTGDGMFFQWVMCIAIWLCGLATTLTTGYLEIKPLAMLGGALWACQNSA